jgi:hypothetical protein
VKDANKSGMADRLKALGFKERGRTFDNGRAFVWHRGPGGRLRKA